jgi:hypothetical protein
VESVDLVDKVCVVGERIVGLDSPGLQDVGAHQMGREVLAAGDQHGVEVDLGGNARLGAGFPGPVKRHATSHSGCQAPPNRAPIAPTVGTGTELGGDLPPGVQDVILVNDRVQQPNIGRVAGRHRAVVARSPRRGAPNDAPRCDHRSRSGRPARIRGTDEGGVTVDAELFGDGLPTYLTRFIGRERECAELADLLRSPGVVAVCGVGGAGKTRSRPDDCSSGSATRQAWQLSAIARTLDCCWETTTVAVGTARTASRAAGPAGMTRVRSGVWGRWVGRHARGGPARGDPPARRGHRRLCAPRCPDRACYAETQLALARQLRGW